MSNMRKFILIIGGALVVISIVWAVYRSVTQVGWWWTGFVGYVDPTGEYQPPITLWNVIELLVIPAALGVVAFLFDKSERKADRDTADLRAQKDREMAQRRAENDEKIATDRQRGTNLQTYLDRMAELLLDRELLAKSNDPNEPVRNVAQTLTISVLRSLDENRKNFVFQFLRDAGLAKSLLTGATLEGIDLSGTDMVGISLSNANLYHAFLSGVNLENANLEKSFLFGAILIETNLSRANLHAAMMKSAFLNPVDLTNADISNADLESANLEGADLSGANLSGANLSGANLSGANLSGANLSGAVISDLQLSSALLGIDTILRDGLRFGSDRDETEPK